ncbi:MAG: hypothetical protein JO353_13220 [Phycisphaerae bacterium]|nr:hypothetical protein [Phycisphaerae bacterium]
MRNRLLAALLLICAAIHAAAPLRAQTNPSADADGPVNVPHPTLSFQDQWVWLLVGVIVLIFLAAAIIGPLYDREASEELPELHMDQERDPHAASQHEPGHTIH